MQTDDSGPTQHEVPANWSLFFFLYISICTPQDRRFFAHWSFPSGLVQNLTIPTSPSRRHLRPPLPSAVLTVFDKYDAGGDDDGPFLFRTEDGRPVVPIFRSDHCSQSQPQSARSQYDDALSTEGMAELVKMVQKDTVETCAYEHYSHPLILRHDDYIKLPKEYTGWKSRNARARMAIRGTISNNWPTSSEPRSLSTETISSKKPGTWFKLQPCAIRRPDVRHRPTKRTQYIVNTPCFADTSAFATHLRLPLSRTSVSHRNPLQYSSLRDRRDSCLRTALQQWLSERFCFTLLMLPECRELNLHWYSDTADDDNDKHDRRSSHGYVFNMAGGVIAYNPSKQTVPSSLPVVYIHFTTNFTTGTNRGFGPFSASVSRKPCSLLSNVEFLLPALPTDILVVLCPTVLHPLCSSSTPTKEGNPESRTLETLPCTDNHKGPYRKKYLVRPKKAVDEVTYGQWSVEVLRDLTTDDSSRDEGPNEEMRAKLPYLVINSPEYIRWRPINDNVLTAFREFRGIKDFTKAGAKSADIVNEQITVGGKESVTAQRKLHGRLFRTHRLIFLNKQVVLG
ncbi:hypothetical protein HDK64DRAFT_331881 [Phyllosticta capitalensis]